VMHLTLLGDEGHVVAFRAHLPVEKTVQMLASLEERGLISVSHQTGKPAVYSASQFVVGFWEGQVNQVDREVAELVEAYLPQFAKKGPWINAMPQIRTIPVGESIPVTTEVMHYERAEEILRHTDDFAVINCVCRQEKEALGRRCDKPMETCMMLGPTAASAINSGTGRKLTREEALNILKLAEQNGMVLQPANSQNPIFLCTCCSCCCGVLGMIKLQEKPADLVANAFIAQFDPDTCASCGTCEERCPMGAITTPGGVTEHNPDRCIGCGLCVSTCPTGALTMVRKPAGQYPSIPRNTTETYLRLGQMRDPLFAVKMAGLLVRSKIEHLIVPRQPER